mgnify:CR=1 FL=1
MNINHKITGTVISACLSLSLLASCNTSPATAPTPMANTTQSQLSNHASTPQMSTLATQAQLALANYHDIDASFYDTARISGQGGFQTKLLGLDLVDDVVDIIDNNDTENDEDNSGSNTQLGLGVEANTSADVNSTIDTNVGANVNTVTSNDLINEMNRNNSRLSTDIMANGAVSVDANGNRAIDDAQLRTNIDTVVSEF